MLTHPYRVAGDATMTYVVQSDDDFTNFRSWLSALPSDTVVALDTETTGLDIFTAGFECRLVQFGTATEAYVIPAAQFRRGLVDIFTEQTSTGRRFVIHNAPFDLLVLDRTGLVDIEALGPLVYDTRILSHLVDPRSAQEGGTGHGLKGLSAIFVDPDAPDTAEGLYTIFRKEYGATKKSGDGWKKIDLFHPTYNLYAGLDVILLARLLPALSRLIRGMGCSGLAAWEHRVMLSGVRMQRRGMLIDVSYTESLVTSLAEEEAKYVGVAKGYGVANINSTKQVIEALQGTGEVWSETTDTGNPSVGKEVLLQMADLDKDWVRRGGREPNLLADAIVRAKRASKWSVAYAQPFLTERDADSRIHPSLNVLAARTARMSVSNPPLQQLPSSDWRIRRSVIASPGKVLISADFSSVELRVLAALADVAEMKTAITEGRDLHDTTASLIWGEEYGDITLDEDGVPERSKAQSRLRKIAKTVGLGKVYGGGVTGLTRQTGLPREGVQRAVEGYNSAFPEVDRYSRHLQALALRNGGYLTTPSGRLLPMDRERAYSAVNHVVQSAARDLMAAAMLRAEETDLLDGLLLPVHDQLLAEVPVEHAEDAVRTLQGVMATSINGVSIASEAEVVGWNWGLPYGAPTS